MIKVDSFHLKERSRVRYFQPVRLVELVLFVLAPRGVTVNNITVAVITRVVEARVLWLESVESIRLACAVVSLAFAVAVVSLADVAVAINSEFLVLLSGPVSHDHTGNTITKGCPHEEGCEILSDEVPNSTPWRVSVNNEIKFKGSLKPEVFVCVLQN